MRWIKFAQNSLLCICISLLIPSAVAQKHTKEKIIFYCADLKRPLSGDDKQTFDNAFNEIAITNKHKVSSLRVKVVYVPFSKERADKTAAQIAIDELVQYFGTKGITKIKTILLDYNDAYGPSDCETIPLWIMYEV